MLLTKAGEIIEKVPEGAPVEYDGVTTIEKKYRVRVVHDEKWAKVIIGEEDFNSDPTAIQILYCILKYQDDRDMKQIFAVVEQVYIPLEYNLPFD